MTYKEYRKFQPKFKDDVLIGYLFSEPLSYILNEVFYRETLIPNLITLYMYLSGISGAVLFFFDGIYKILGFILMHLWFVFDAWDGPVARQTKRFSIYGKEFDYLIHSIVHPLFFLALYFSTNSFIFLIYLIINLIKRSLYNIDIHSSFFEESQEKNKSNIAKDIIYYILGTFSQAPNFILTFPVLIFFDMNQVVEKVAYIFIACEIISVLNINRIKLKEYMNGR